MTPSIPLGLPRRLCRKNYRRPLRIEKRIRQQCGPFRGNRPLYRSGYALREERHLACGVQSQTSLKEAPYSSPVHVLDSCQTVCFSFQARRCMYFRRMPCHAKKARRHDTHAIESTSSSQQAKAGPFRPFGLSSINTTAPMFIAQTRTRTLTRFLDWG